MVIGVVAALTIPNLVQSYKERAIITKVKEIHSILNQAYRMAANEHGDYDSWIITRHQTISNLKPYLKVIKDCTGKTEEICAPTDYVNTNDTSVSFCNNNGNFNASNTCVGNIFVLDNGMIVYSSTISDTPNRRGNIFVDIDGIKGKNKTGHDLFFFSISNNGVSPYDRNPINISLTTHYSIGRGSTHWIIKNGNMDYLHKTVDWTKL